MKNLFTALLLLFFFSCKESGVRLSKPSTFVHYYNGGYNDDAQDIIATSDNGFLILANSLISSSANRIKLIKTDAYGNEVWQKLFPDPSLGSSSNFSAFGITPVPNATTGEDDGYLLVGEEIYGDPKNNLTPAHSLLMIQVDKNGIEVNSTTKTYDSVKIGVQVRGQAVTYSKISKNFIVLGQDLSGPKDDMFLAAFDGTTLNTQWTRTYGAGSTTLANRLFLYGDSISWAGTQTIDSKSLMAWKKTLINTSAVSANTYPSGATINFTCTDICQYGFGYGFVGSYGALSNTSFNRIAFYRIDAYGNSLDSATYALPFSQTYQTGNSITSTNDGGFLILGTKSFDNAVTNTDYYLIKTDVHGKQMWVKEYGGKFFDFGKKVIQASDGGYIVLGTTKLANLESIFLMKTDSEGNIQ